MSAPSNAQYQNGQTPVTGDQFNTFVQGTTTAATLRGFIGLPGMNVLLQGIATAGDSGAGMFWWNPSSTAADDNFNYIVPPSSSSGAWNRLQIEGAFYINVKSFGATGNGVTDDTVAIQSAINSAGTAGGIMFFPPGTYLYSALTVNADVSLLGSGAGASTLLCSGTGTITIYGASFVKDLQFASPSARTAGSTLSLQGNDIQIQNCTAKNYFLFATVGTFSSVQAIGARFLDIDMFSPATGAGSGGILFLNYSTGVVQDCIITGTITGNQPDFGIRADNGDTLLLSNCNITRHGSAFLSITPAGQNIYATMAVNCLFDSGGTTSSGASSSCTIEPFGNVEDVQFSNCWFGLSIGESGCILSSANGGTVVGVDFAGCKFVGNAIDGLTCTGSGVSNITVSGGDAGGNANAGLNFENGATSFTVTGVRAGNTDTRGANGTGILTSGGGNNYLIVGNNLHGNTIANLTDGATGSTKVVANNLTT
jgi:hypothetical protein